MVRDVDRVVLLVEGLIEGLGVELGDEGVVVSFLALLAILSFLGLLLLLELGLLFVVLLLSLFEPLVLLLDGLLSLLFESLFAISSHFYVFDSDIDGEFEPSVEFSQGD